MRSINEQREVIHQAMIKHGIHTHNRSPQIDALIEVACDSLDWVERARKLFSFWYGEPTKEKVGDFDTLAAWKLLTELPEE